MDGYYPTGRNDSGQGWDMSHIQPHHSCMPYSKANGFTSIIPNDILYELSAFLACGFHLLSQGRKYKTPKTLPMPEKLIISALD